MRYIKNALLALLVGCCVPVVIWVAGGVALYQASYQRRKGKELAGAALPDLACSVDTDCPHGYMCINGYCVPEGMV
jgi:hypothetical protein